MEQKPPSEEPLKKDEEGLLGAIQRVARERDLLSDPRWDALAHGTLSEAEEAALREEAKQSPAMAEAYEVFRPLDAATKEAMVERVAAKSPAPPVAKARRGRRAWVAVLAAAAVALALAALVVLIPPRREPVPAYAIAVVGGEQTQLGGPADAGALPELEAPESRLEVTLRPATSAKAAIAVRAWLVRDRRAQRWDPPIQATPEGVFLIAGTKRALFSGVAAGSWELVFAVGQREALPADTEILSEIDRSADHPAREQACQILRATVLLRTAKDGQE